jgi:uncharacterized protein
MARWAIAYCGVCFAVSALAQVPWQAEFDGALKQREFSRAFGIAKDAAERNETHGKYLHAAMLRDGTGTARDTNRARQLFTELAAGGHIQSQLALGELLRAGIGGPKDLDGAASQFRRAADQGHAVAMLQLSRLYRLTDFPDRDDSRAFEWALKSANTGHAPAYGVVGYLILTGTGVNKDPEIAVAWLKGGHEKGDLTSRAYYGLALATGTGVPRNAVLGGQLLNEAANAGNLDAMTTLASLHQVGQVMPRDYMRAYLWANIAISRGAAGASLLALRDDLERRLSPDQLGAMQKQAREWKPQLTARPITGGAEARALPSRGSGTGFFISASGHLLTNQHVVNGCHRITTDRHGEATLVASDAKMDLAILKVEHPADLWATIRVEPPRLGESVYVFGYPLQGVLSSSGNFTSGVVSALVGFRNDPTRLQVSAPIQPGNSGGPVLDQSGRVLGVTVSTASSMRIANATGSIPQNLNFAVHGAVARALIGANGLTPESPGATFAPVASEEIAERARRFSVLVTCFR